MGEFLALFNTNRFPLILAAILAHLALFSSVRLRHIFSFPLSLTSDLILVFNQRYNRSHGTIRTRRKDSYSIAIFLIIFGLITGLGLSVLTYMLPYGRIIDVLILAAFLGIRPLMRMTRLMTKSFQNSVEEARATLTLLTGRITFGLDRQAMAAIGIDVIANWMVQWIVAPIFWFALGGLPALFVFKFIDTACTMIDERSDEAKDFGFASRIFAGVLMLPATLLSLLLLLPGGLVLKDVSVKRGASALILIIRRGGTVLRLPSVLISGMLGVSVDTVVGTNENDGEKYKFATHDYKPADSSHLRKSSKLAALGVITLFTFIGILAWILTL